MRKRPPLCMLPSRGFALWALAVWLSGLPSGAWAQSAPVSTFIGSAAAIAEGNGVVMGWALNLAQARQPVVVKVFVDAPGDQGGVPAGDATAAEIDKQVNWSRPTEGNHGFAFRIPDRWRDGVQHRLYVQIAEGDGSLSVPLPFAGGNNVFTLAAETKVHVDPVTDAHCLSADSRCPFVADDALAPNYPAPSGWSDTINYFETWGCSSSAGLDTIARLNILPLGSFGPHFQKDSLAVDEQDEADGKPIVYLTTTSMDHAPRWSLKKAIFSAAASKWQIFSVLDNPGNPGGLSSQDGRGQNIIVNDYSLPGWGPASPLPGGATKVPGVAQASASAARPIYPLVGSGPLGLTSMLAIVYPVHASGGVEGRTCIHMNPKLLDYDANGVPHSFVANLWQDNPQGNACRLPAGAPVAQLPAPGNYIYRYEGPDLGWQLDLSTGLVTDSLHAWDKNQFMLTPKLLVGTEHRLVTAVWDGVIETIDPALPRERNTEVILDCKASQVHFAEAAGRADGVFFLAVKPDIAAERARYHLADDVMPGDIFYAFKARMKR